MTNDPFSSEKNGREELERRRRLFEQHWKSSSVRRIREEIEAVPPEWRDEHLRELLYIEFEFLLRDNQTLALSEYTDEFLEHESLIKEVVNEVSGYPVFHPKTVGPYTLIEEIGHGGMGVVYRARHNLLDKQVALKIIKKDYVDNEAAVQRFLMEIKSLGRLSHPNIVMATDAGIDEDGAPYLVMELIAGHNLSLWSRRHHRNKSFSPRNFLRTPHWIPACEIIRNAALGLQAIHEAGMVHRDIKPENLILQDDGTIKILDLGLAKLHRRFAEGAEETAHKTRQGLLLGTLGYIAPEQLYSPSQVDIRADIYSLGGTFFHLLYGRSPAEKDQNEIRYAVPKKIRSILDRTLAADPTARYREPIELVQDLNAFLAQNKRTNRLVFSLVVGAFVLAGALLAFFRFPNVSELEANSRETSSTIPHTAFEAAGFLPVNHVSGMRKIDTALAAPEKSPWDPHKELSRIAEAVEWRWSGNIEQARAQLLDLEKRWGGKPEIDEATSETFSAELLLPFVYSALGDCEFFSGVASGPPRNRKRDRVAKCYEDALRLSAANSEIPESFKAEWTCKSIILETIRNEQEPEANGNGDAKHRLLESWTKIPNRRLQLLLQLTEAVTVFVADEKPLRNFVEQFELSVEPELFTRESRELRLFALEYLIARDRRDDREEKLTDDLQFLDRILFSFHPDPGDCVYLRRYFDLAVSCCRSDDYSRLVRYLLRLRPQNTSGSRITIPENATIVLFYFSPIKDVKGFAVYYPKDRQQARRFEFSKNRNEIKEAIEHELSLPLDDELIALIRKDRTEGIPIVLSWDDSSCWPPLPRKDAFRDEDWPFEESLSLEELLGQLK